MCIFYRLCIVLGSHLLFIRHHMRSGWALGLKLLEGRNILRVPEDMPPCLPGSTTISPWVNFYTPILYWAHLRVTGPGILCLCLPATDWIDVLGACLGCTHRPGSVRDVPMWWASPTRCSCRAGVYTPGSDPVYPREDQLPLWSTVTAPLGPSCLCPAPLHFSSHRDLFSSGERDSVPCPADRAVSKEVFAWVHSGLNWDFGSHHGPRAPPTVPGREADPAFLSIPV